MTSLKQLIEQAKSKTEDGTVADLGPVPTGHKVYNTNDKDLDFIDSEDIMKED